MDQVNAHIRRVSQDGSCRPKLKVISIQHNPMKTYSPHCTVLHRCSDDTGCCHSDYMTCHPRRIQNVSLPFWVSFIFTCQAEPLNNKYCVELGNNLMIYFFFFFDFFLGGHKRYWST